MLWFALVVIALAGLTYVAFRYWVNEDLRAEARAKRQVEGAERRREQRRVRKAERDRRPFAPDDDEEFLRELDRRRLHGDE